MNVPVQAPPRVLAVRKRHLSLVPSLLKEDVSMPTREEELLEILRRYKAETEKEDAKKNEGATLKLILDQQLSSERNILRTFTEHEAKDDARHDDTLDMIRALRARIKDEVKSAVEKMSLPPARGRDISEHDLEQVLEVRDLKEKVKSYDFLKSVAAKVLVAVLVALALVTVGAMIGKHLLP